MKSTERILTDKAEKDREDFEAAYGSSGNCSCHINPPCSSCMHPGNPVNQEEDETCWRELPPMPKQEGEV